MNLLQIVQTFCGRTGLPRPAYVATSSDAQVAQILSLLNEVCEDITSRWDWQTLTLEILFTTTDGEDQGDFFRDIISLDRVYYKKVVKDTIFDRTLRLPLYGPMTAQKWQAIKALPTTGPLYKYRIRGDRLLFSPAAVAGHSCAFEITTHLCVMTALGGQRNQFQADTDTFFLDERLLLAGLRWKWKAEKGMDYAEELTRYEYLGAQLAGSDGTKATLSMSGGQQDMQPGIFVSPGNWNLP